MTDSFFKLRIPAKFVDTCELPDVLDPPPSEERLLGLGWPVIISRGKHAGKTGRVVVRERWHVRIIEDASYVEVSDSIHTADCSEHLISWSYEKIM